MTKDSPPWPLLMRAAALAPREGCALDAGAGRDTRYLLEQGFHVTAVDADPRAVALLSAAFPRRECRRRVCHTIPIGDQIELVVVHRLRDVHLYRGQRHSSIASLLVTSI